MEVGTGQTIGWLTITEYSYKDVNSRKYWNCKCRCGRDTVVRESDLKRGHTRSCGCMRGWNNAKNH